MCFYENFDFTGSASIQPRLSPGNPGFANHIDNFQNSHFTDGESLNDQVSSVHNYTFYNVVLHVDSNGNGAEIVIPPNSDIADMRSVPSSGCVYCQDVNFNDVASSAYLYS